jgi:hypothetical protein
VEKQPFQRPSDEAQLFCFMKRLLSLFVLLVPVLFSLSIHAQMPGGPPEGMNALLHRLFEKHAFTAKADVQLRDTTQVETLRMVMGIAASDGKMRAEVDMTQMKAAQLSPEVLAQMKQLGMDRVISITRPDKQAMFLVYPGMKSYVEMPMSKEEVAAFRDPTPLKSVRLGKETVQGQACVKNRVTVTDEKGQKQDVLVWNATGLKDFPIQVQTQEGGNTVTIQFREVKLSRPDAKEFEPEPGYTKYASTQQMMLQKFLGPSPQ